MTVTAMTLTERTVGEVAAELPISIRVFEAWKIDYCCGGKTPMTDACAAAGKSVDAFISELEALATVEPSRDWTKGSLHSISQGICSMYHDYTRQELQTITPIAEKVLSVHGERRPELAEVLALIHDLAADMIPHMLKEEQVLFPYVAQLEEAANRSQPAPTPFFGTVKNPVRMMMMEHDRVGDLLARLRVTSDQFTPPESACFSYRELYRRLTDFEARTHEHIHIENNIYFPRAVSLEENAGKPEAFDGCGMGGSQGCAH
jgi:regulator of cell morphogenesis and NO signaling